MIHKAFIVSLFILSFFQLIFNVSYSSADNAEVLPKGVSRVSLDARFYLPIDQRYDPDGKVEDVAVDYNTTLGSSVFPALGLVESAFGMPAGSASMGKSIVDFEYDISEYSLSYQYGVTDRWTLGINIPYWSIRNKIDARLDSSAGTGANIGKNSTINSFAPLIFPGTVPLTTEDVQDLLGGGLDINNDGTLDVPGYGYNRVETWSHEGLSDIEAGGRYQYLRTKDWRLAFTGALRFPTGRVDDPDNLADYAFGSGANALLFHLNNDFTGIKNFVFNGTFRYDLVLPDKETKRVPEDVNLPITNNKEEVKRDIGDGFELEASGKYDFLEGANVSLLYNYRYKLKDQISGSQGFAYQALEDETDVMSHIYIIGLSYSTVSMYMNKKFPIPLIAYISYRDRFAGSNNVNKSQYLAGGIQVFF